MKQKIFEVGKKAYTFNQARYEEDMGRCVITAVSVLGTTQYADKKIYIANTSQAATESTIHEVGHFVDYSNGFLSDQEKFKELYLSEVRIYIKAYDAVCVRGRKELFAEVFWQYLTNPSKLQLETPGLYFYMKNTLHTFYSF